MKILFLLLSLFFLSCDSTTVNFPEKPEASATAENSLPIDKIKLPAGFSISIFAEDVENARSMDLSPNGTLFIGTRSKGSVYALRDTDGDHKADEKYILMEGGNMPNGVAFKDGDLYVAEVNRILKFADIESKLSNPGEPIVIYDKYPEEKHHGWKFIEFGPDGKLYVPVGAPCNICESKDDIFNSITRINPDGTEMEIVQRGVRNTVGFTWHPVTKELWFTDNGRDMLGEDIPACELNRASKDQMHFGYPYCHQGDILDPEYGTKKNCADYTAPVQNLGPHVAPLGVEFYQAGQFSEAYRNKAFIAEHGSWNRKKKIGYRITTVSLDDNFNSTGYDVFAEGWLDEEKDEVWGRPVDVEWMPDGSMLVSDDFADVVYRISYKG
jgi:glucose/arabinose dehydrogenase